MKRDRRRVLGSILLVIGSPDVEPSQPRALVGGHRPFDSGDLPHRHLPSAGQESTSLLIVSGNLLMTFLLAPVLAGAVILTGRRLRLAPLGTAPELAQRWV